MLKSLNSVKSKFIKKVATDMVTKEEIRTRRVSCKIACEFT